MKRLLAALLLSLLALNPLSADQLDSIQPLQGNGSNICTTFSINEDKGYWSTAYHCLAYAEQYMLTMTINDEAVIVHMVNPGADTAVLQSYARAKALRLSDKAPKPNIPVSVVGHPFGFIGMDSPHIITRGEFLNRVEDDGMWGLYDVTAGPGNSGSPVLDKKGRVVGTLNFGWPSAGRLSGGTLWEVLKELVDKGVWKGVK